MSVNASAKPVARQRGEGDARWFLGGLSIIKASGETTEGRVAVTENWAPQGYGSPLHVHHREDEWFYVLSGELRSGSMARQRLRAKGRSSTARETCLTPSS